MSDLPLNHQLYIFLRSLSFLIILVILTLNCMQIGDSLSCQTFWIFPVTTEKYSAEGTVQNDKSTIVILSVSIRKFCLLSLNSAYLIIGTPYTYNYHNDASPDGRDFWKQIIRFTSVMYMKKKPSFNEFQRHRPNAKSLVYNKFISRKRFMKKYSAIYAGI